MLIEKQKKVIKKYFDKGVLDKDHIDYGIYLDNYNKMYREVETIRDCETLSQDIRRYIEDLENE